MNVRDKLFDVRAKTVVTSRQGCQGNYCCVSCVDYRQSKDSCNKF